MRSLGRLRLGLGIDHVAALRNGSAWPDPLRAALLAEAAGADGITAHLRPGGGLVGDEDIGALMAGISIPLTLSMAPDEGMAALVLAHRPHAVCLTAPAPDLAARLRAEGIRVGLLVTPGAGQVEAAAAAGAQAVKLHTGRFCALSAEGGGAGAELAALREAARRAHDLGLEVQLGRGLAYDTAAEVAAIPEALELHIGHFLIGEAIFRGLGPAIEEMRRRMDAARQGWA